jgi:hypothetical protein
MTVFSWESIPDVQFASMLVHLLFVGEKKGLGCAVTPVCVWNLGLVTAGANARCSSGETIDASQPVGDADQSMKRHLTVRKTSQHGCRKTDLPWSGFLLDLVDDHRTSTISLWVRPRHQANTTTGGSNKM